jgi:hypothetical protein
MVIYEKEVVVPFKLLYLCSIEYLTFSRSVRLSFIFWSLKYMGSRFIIDVYRLFLLSVKTNF